jgi:hypothetical protein
MGNPAIIYPGGTIDLGGSGLSDASPGTNRTSEVVQAKTVQTTLIDLFDGLRLEKKQFADAVLFRSLRSFWSYAAAGGVFGVTLDSAKTLNSYLIGDHGLGNQAPNGDLSAWTGIGTSAVPSSWVLPVVTNTLWSRETRREFVHSGLYCLRLTCTSAAVNSASVTTTFTVPAYSVGVVRVWLKGYQSSLAYSATVRLQNVATGLYWNGTTWASGATDFQPTQASTYDWYQYSLPYSIGASGGTLKVSITNVAACTDLWIDDLEILVGTPGSTFQVHVNSGAGAVAGDHVVLVSRTTGLQESFSVSSVSVGAGDQSFVTLDHRPNLTFGDRDILRHADFYPELVADESQKTAAVFEEAGNLFTLDLKCRTSWSGRT